MKRYRISGVFTLLSMMATLLSTENIMAQTEDGAGIYATAHVAEGAAQTVISGDVLRRTNHINLAAALVGRIPGLQVTSTSNEPSNEQYEMRIRGNSTTGIQDPLILLDGLKVDDLSTITVMDVESVTVLKDASAIAIYGLDAANGVILVNTKRGESGEPSINVGVNTTFQKAAKTPTMINSGEYAELMNEASANDGNGTYSLYSQSQIDSYYAGDNPDFYPNNNWYDQFMEKYVNTTNAYLNASGGGEFVNYYTSIDFLTQGSPFVEDHDYSNNYGLDRMSIRTNLDAKISPMVSAYLNVSTRISKNLSSDNVGGNAAIYESIFDLAPNVYGPLTPDGGVVVPSTQNDSPTYGLLNRSGYLKATTVNIFANLGVNLNLDVLTKGLKLTVEGAYLNNLDSNMHHQSDYAKYMVDPTSTSQLSFISYGTTKDEAITLSKNVNSNYTARFSGGLSYFRTFDKHSVGANAIMSYYYALSYNDRFPDEYLNRSLSLSYSYDNKLYVDLMASHNASTKMDPDDHPFGFSPSVAVAYNFGSYDWIKDNSILTGLKVRASYGQICSDGFNPDAGDYMYKDDIVIAGGKIEENKFANNNLIYEKANILNVGVDIQLFKSLDLSVDYFNNRRTNIIMESNTTPLMAGVADDNRAWSNVGEIRNKGFEVALAYQKSLNKDLSMAISGHVSYAKNRVVSSGDLPYDKSYYYPERNEGYPLGQLWGYQVDYSNGNGFFNSESDITNSGLTYSGANPRVGDLIFMDLNNDNVIDEKDQAPLDGQSSTPEWIYGLEYQLVWKDFDFSMLWQGVSGLSSMSKDMGYYENASNGTFFTNHLSAYTPERYANGDDITAPALSLDGSSSQVASSYYVANKNYLRLKNLQIGYNIPRKLFGGIAVRVYASAMNLLTIDAFNSDDFDPEMGAVTDFPVYRYYSFGANFNF